MWPTAVSSDIEPQSGVTSTRNQDAPMLRDRSLLPHQAVESALRSARRHVGYAWRIESP